MARNQKRKLKCCSMWSSKNKKVTAVGAKVQLHAMLQFKKNAHVAALCLCIINKLLLKPYHSMRFTSVGNKDKDKFSAMCVQILYTYMCTCM